MHDDDADDDPEFPDATDMDGSADEDDEQDLLERCPSCKRMVYADADRCPYCGSYISPARKSAGLPAWVIVTAVLVLLAFLWIGFH